MNRQFIVIGAERSGKTFFANAMSQNFLRGKKPVFVYASMTLSDWDGFRLAEPLKESEYENLIGKDRLKGLNDRREFFRVAGKVLHISEMVSSGGGYLVPRISSRKAERMFYTCVWRWLSPGLFWIDDARPVTRLGISAELSELLSRKNHSGQWGKTGRVGMDVGMIFHSLSRVNEEIFDYATDLILYRTSGVLGQTGLEEDVDKSIEKARDLLDSEKKYTAFQIPLRGPTAGSLIKIKGEQVLKMKSKRK
jgi:hypothetical protein